MHPERHAGKDESLIRRGAHTTMPHAIRQECLTDIEGMTDNSSAFADSIELGGYAAAHTVSILKDSRGASFTPLYLTLLADGTLVLNRLAAGSDAELAQMVQHTEQAADVVAGALVNDGYFTYEDGSRLDAILITCYGEPAGDVGVVFAVPYVPKRLFAPMKLHRLKLVHVADALLETDQTAYASSFFAGVDRYPDSGFWDRLTDPTR